MWTPKSWGRRNRQSLVLRCLGSPVVLGLCLSAFSSLCWSADHAEGLLSAARKHEQPYALIFGTVWGPDNRPVYGVKVKIRRENEKKARWEQYSDHNGEFAQRVPVGPQDYVVWADLKGYKSLQGNQLHPDEVKVHVDGDERADTGLHLK
jgi:hypothetical protein